MKQKVLKFKLIISYLKRNFKLNHRTNKIKVIDSLQTGHFHFEEHWPILFLTSHERLPVTQLQAEQAPFLCLSNRLFVGRWSTSQTIILHSLDLVALEWFPHFSLPIHHCFACSSSWSLSSFEPRVKWILDLFWYFRNHIVEARWYTHRQHSSSIFGLRDSVLVVFEFRPLW